MVDHDERLLHGSEVFEQRLYLSNFHFPLVGERAALRFRWPILVIKGASSLAPVDAPFTIEANALIGALLELPIDYGVVDIVDPVLALGECELFMQLFLGVVEHPGSEYLLDYFITLLQLHQMVRHLCDV